MYTLQALWTQARESLDVTTVIFANRSYAILNIELARVGAGDPGPKAFSDARSAQFMNLIGSSLLPEWASRRAAQRRLKNSRGSSQAL